MRTCDYIAGFVKACQDRGMDPGSMLKTSATLADMTGRQVGSFDPRPATTRGASYVGTDGKRRTYNTRSRKTEMEPADQVTDNKAIAPASTSQVA